MAAVVAVFSPSPCLLLLNRIPASFFPLFRLSAGGLFACTSLCHSSQLSGEDYGKPGKGGERGMIEVGEEDEGKV